MEKAVFETLEKDYIFYKYVSGKDNWEIYLREAMELITGMSKNSELFEVKKSTKGKPYFPNLENIYNFSITHSGGIWMCVISNSNVGIDLQIKKVCDYEKIAKRFFSENEYEYLKENNFLNFYDIWTRKESLVKYTGNGIDKNFKQTNVVNNDNSSSNGKIKIRTISFLDNYSLSISGGTKELEILSL